MNKIYSLNTNKHGMNRVKNHNATGKPVTTRVLSDVLGCMMSRASSDGSEASYDYDVRGLMTHAQSNVPGEVPVQVRYEYDAAGRRTAELQIHHNHSWRLTHELDALGHRNSTRVPDAGTIAWQRYGSGHIHGVLLNGHTLANFERDALHQETKQSWLDVCKRQWRSQRLCPSRILVSQGG
jgi:type VI secretion system secreted protein VgrG